MKFLKTYELNIKEQIKEEIIGFFNVYSTTTSFGNREFIFEPPLQVSIKTRPVSGGNLITIYKFSGLTDSGKLLVDRSFNGVREEVTINVWGVVILANLLNVLKEKYSEYWEGEKFNIF